MNYVWLAVGAVLSGIVGGMGMGGGTLLIPVLTIFFKFNQQNAQGINLLVFIPMSIVAVIIHMKNNLINYKVGITLMLSGIITSVLASILANKLNSKLLSRLFGGFLLIIAVFQIIQLIRMLKTKKEPQSTTSTICITKN